ncbi:hypothetical protein [Prosthecochloris sp.]|nr:hypothetical protein [Prosthecochloris sp.]
MCAFLGIFDKWQRECRDYSLSYDGSCFVGDVDDGISGYSVRSVQE